jgi:WhiB family redox-sensing transcriptional regulator
MTTKPHWRELAACKGMNLNMFFPVAQDCGSWAEAKEVCARCPVTDECRQYALDNGIHDGVWGGTDMTRGRAPRRHYQEKVCACGCGATFEPRSSTQLYATPQCTSRGRARRFRGGTRSSTGKAPAWARQSQRCACGCGRFVSGVRSIYATECQQGTA